MVALEELMIKLNNRLYPFREGMTASALMTENSFVASYVYVRINGKIIEEEDWCSTVITAGDNVEMIHIFGGG